MGFIAVAIHALVQKTKVSDADAAIVYGDGIIKPGSKQKTRVELLSSVNGRSIREWTPKGYVFVGQGYVRFVDAETGEDVRLLGNVAVFQVDGGK